MRLPSGHSTDDARFRILRLLDEDPEMSQRDLARAVGISLGGTNYALRALVEKGLAAKAALTRRFLKRKMAAYETLRAEIRALEAELSTHRAETTDRSGMPD